MPIQDTPGEAPPEPLLSIEEAAELVGLSVNTLNNYRAQGRGPEFTSVDGKAVYRRSDLDAWTGITDGLLDAQGAARFIGCTVEHLANLRCYGAGPPFVRMKGQRGKMKVFYREDDVITWRDAR